MKKILSLLLAVFTMMNTGIVFAQGNNRYITIVEPKFDDAQHFSEGYAAVCQNGKWGYINERGEWLIEPIYDYASYFSEGKAVVGIFNNDSEELIWGTSTLGFIDTIGNYTPLLSQEYLENPTLSHTESSDPPMNAANLAFEKNTDTTVCRPEIPNASLLNYDWYAEKVTGFQEVYYINGYLSIEHAEGDFSSCWIFDSSGKRINSYFYEDLPNEQFAYGSLLWGGIQRRND